MTTGISISERKWIDRLQRLLDSMPPDLYALVTYRDVEICRPRVVKGHFDEHGDLDNVPTIELISSKNMPRFQPHSEGV